MSSRLQHNAGGSGTAGTTMSDTFGGAQTSGSILVGYAYWNSATATATIGDATNGLWQAVGSPLRCAGAIAAYSIQLFAFFNNVSVGTPLITLTTSVSTTDKGLGFAEYSAGPTTIGSSNYKTRHGCRSPTQALTPATSGSIMLGFALCASAAHTSAGTGFTIFESSLMGNNPIADDLAPTGGASTSIVWSGGGAQDVGLAFVSLDVGGLTPPVAWIHV